MPTKWKWAVAGAYILIIVSFGMTWWSARTINTKGRALREWATTIPKWAAHTQLHDHPTPPPVDHVQPPPDPPPFW